MDFSPDALPVHQSRTIARCAAQPRPVIDPATLETVGAIAAATEPKSTPRSTPRPKAQTAWKRLDAKTRAKHLHAVANAIEAADFTAAPS